MPNEDIMGIPTRACINGLTKEDTDRLKNALIKKIEDDETTVEITEDGKIIFADDNNLFLSFDGNILGITRDASGDYIPWTVPYLPEDENENPIVPPNDTIMTSANIGVDPRIVHTTGSENIAGDKTFSGMTNINGGFSLCRTMMTLESGKWAKFYTIPRRTGGRRVLFVVRQVGSLSTFDDLVAVYISASDNGISKSSLPMVLCKYDSHSDLWIQNSTSSTQGMYVDVLFNAGEMPKSDPSEPMDNHPIVGESGCTAVTTIGVWN